VCCLHMRACYHHPFCHFCVIHRQCTVNGLNNPLNGFMRGTATTEQSSNSRRGPCSGSHLPTFTEASVSLRPVRVGFVVHGQVLPFLLSRSCHQLPYPSIHNTFTGPPPVHVTVHRNKLLCNKTNQLH